MTNIEQGNLPPKSFPLPAGAPKSSAGIEVPLMAANKSSDSTLRKDDPSEFNALLKPSNLV